MLAARLAGEDAHVDQARRKDEAFAVDDFGIVAVGIVEKARPEIDDLAVLDQQPALDVEARARIDQARIAKCRAAVAHGALGLSRAKPRESASRTAMRIATPISTCSR